MPLLNKSSTINTRINYPPLTRKILLFKLFFIFPSLFSTECGPSRAPRFHWTFHEMKWIFGPVMDDTSTTHDENREISTGVRLNQQVKLHRWAVDHRVGIAESLIIFPLRAIKGKTWLSLGRGIKRWREGGAEVSVNRLGKIRKED